MTKLLRANFSRLFKDKVFRACVIIMAIYALVFMLYGGFRASQDTSGTIAKIESYYYSFIMALGAFAAFSTSLFIGTDYSDGTIRNKIIVGHSRSSIYLANLITNFGSSLILMLVWMVLALVGIPLLGFFTIPLSTFLLFILLMFLICLAYAAIFTLVSMLSGNKTLALALSVIIFFVLLITASMCMNALDEPEMISGIMMTSEGMKFGEGTPNHRYVAGFMRTVYQWIIDFLPTGQALQIAFARIGNIVFCLCSSVAITIGTTLIGLFVFNGKDLK